MMAENVQAGHYAQKQIFSRSSLIAWSHRSRFLLARQIVQPYAGARLLDYGCGDGTFLAQVADLFPTASARISIPVRIRTAATASPSIPRLPFASSMTSNFPSTAALTT